MQVYNNGYYRAYFKQINDVNGKIYATAKVSAFSLENDLISSPCSEFEVDFIPNNVITGDVCLIATPAGELFYKGVIESIEGNKITAGEILKVFDDEFAVPMQKYKINCKLHELPQKLIDLCLLQNASEEIDKDQNIQLQAEYKVVNNKNLTVQRSYENFSTFNLYTELKELYSKRNLVVDLEMELNDKDAVKKVVSTYTGDKFVYKIINNSVYTVNFVFEEETTPVNKLLIYKKLDDSGNYSFVKKVFLTPNGLTEDQYDLSRLRKIKTKNVFLEKDSTDADVQKAIDENISDTMYLHQIEIELLADNPLYDYRKMLLGEKYEIFANNKFYKSVLTGIKFKKDSLASEMRIILVFGKSRTKLTDLVLT